MQEVADQGTAMAGIEELFDGFPALFEDNEGNEGTPGAAPSTTIGSTFGTETQDSGDLTDQIVFGVDELSVAGPSGTNHVTPNGPEQKRGGGDDDYVIE